MKRTLRRIASKFIQSKLVLGVIAVVFPALIILVVNKTDTRTPRASYDPDITQVSRRFESSNSRSRYALTEAIVENSSLTLDLTQARFSAPDVVYLNQKFFTIFTPGISLVAVPFYKVGKWFGNAQSFTFISTALFAIGNIALISRISFLLTKRKFASLIGGLLFFVGSNALAYSLSLTQHHGSTFILLLSILLTFYKPTILRNILFGMLCGIGFLFDFPNLFMMFPVGLFMVWKHFDLENTSEKLNLKIDFRFLSIALGFIPFLFLFGWYNTQTGGSPLALAQLFPQTEYFDTPEKQEEKRRARQNVDPFGDKVPFSTRAQLRSFYILFISTERSWFYYSPIVIIGFLAFIKNPQLIQNKHIVLILSVIFMNILMYGMFSDPWGGWSFGPRYLIPATGLTSILVACAIDRHGKNIFFITTFTAASVYSIGIATAGALTTTLIPPKVEAEQLLVFVPYNYQYNFQRLNENKSNTYFYERFFSSTTTAKMYWLGITSSIVTVMAFLYLLNLAEGKKDHA